MDILQSKAFIIACVLLIFLGAILIVFPSKEASESKDVREAVKKT